MQYLYTIQDAGLPCGLAASCSVHLLEPVLPRGACSADFVGDV